MVGLLIWLACGQKTIELEVCDACGGDCQQDSLPDRGNDHVAGSVDYADHPPASGDHWPCWAEWGVHSEAVPPENWVHNLEHGGVVFLWNCPEGCAEDQAAIEALVHDTLPVGRALSTPYADMAMPYAAVSWQHRLQLSCLDIPALTDFFYANIGHAPEDLVSPPNCTDSGGGM